MSPLSAVLSDHALHHPLRVGILLHLSTGEHSGFGAIQRTLGIRLPQILSQHLDVLADAGYVTRARYVDGGHARTTVMLTPAGRRALARYRDFVGSTPLALFPTQNIREASP